MTGIARLQKYVNDMTAEQKKSALKTEEAVKTFDEKVTEPAKVSEALDAAIMDKLKTGLTMDEWAQFLNVRLMQGAKNNGWDTMFVRDLKAAKGLRHDTVVSIVKKLAKAGADVAIVKTACKATFPHSEYFL